MYQKNIYSILDELTNYCEKNEFKGWDPFDGLNSKLFQAIPYIRTSRFFRLAWIQFFKRCPINFRPIVNISKGYNPKALGLFLSGYCNLYKIEHKREYFEKIIFLCEKIKENVSNGWNGACWGYNFDWQARVFFQPKYSPTIVATSFIANALLDAYELVKDEDMLKLALSSCEFILKDINRTKTRQGFIFSYSPIDKTSVYNASLLGARLLARAYNMTGNKDYYKVAQQAVLGACKAQNEDGSWFNAIEGTQQWIDNFHTAYNLECINDYQLYTEDYQFSLYLKKGMDYYINNFFTEKGEPKYYNNQKYPIDIHCCSQLFITLYKFNIIDQHQDLMGLVYNWTMENMYSKQGYFFYQKKKIFKNRIPYMRWSQAWMFYALTMLYLHQNGNEYDINNKNFS